MNFSFGPTHLRIISAITKHSSCYVVGGAVRDAILGVPCHDIDFATPMYFPFLQDQLIAAGLDWIPDKKAAEHGIIRIIDPIQKGVIDVAVFRKDVKTDGRHAIVQFTDSIIHDLARRDLTINAMASAISHDGSILPGLIDPFGGRNDLARSSICLVGQAEDRITEDFLRMLRVARFAAKFGKQATIDPATVKACRLNASKISGVSKERVREEILKALEYPEAGWMFRNMQTLGLLEYLMPDLYKGVNSLQNKEHNYSSVFDHLCRCVDACRGKKFTPMLKLATLFHDIAKPHTSKVINGDVTFHNHEVVGASLAYNWMKEYTFSNSECIYVSKLVRHHQWRFYDDTSLKTYRKWLQEVGRDGWRDLVRLRMADRKGNLTRVDRPAITRKMKQLIRIVRTIIASKEPLFFDDLALDGNDLRALGLVPGPQFKAIMTNMLGIVVEDPSKNTREWLTDFVKRVYLKDENGITS